MQTSHPLIPLLFEALEKPAALRAPGAFMWKLNREFWQLLGQTGEVPDNMPLFLYRADDGKQDITQALLDQALAGTPWNGTVAVGATQTAAVSANVELIAAPSGHILVLARLIEQAPGADDLKFGVPGAFLLKDRLRQAIITAARAGKSLAMVLVGIDRFRAINQGLGQAAGDVLLTEVANRLKTCVRTSDTVAHFRDDQFALVLQVASADDGAIVARKVLEATRRKFVLAESEVSLSVSIGISLSPVDANDAEGLLKLADSALHEAKQHGGDKYQFFAEEFNIRARHRIELEKGMRRALRDNEFRLFYQPKVSAQSKRIVGMEGLIRWIDPQSGMISPGVFIPLAEESGLIDPIGRWVMREACRQNREWLDKGLAATKVSINVSGRQLHAADFVDFVAQVLRESELPPHLLELELTESMLVQRTEDVIVKLRQVRDLGCHLSIDDFGTGYSSLSYLTRFPITTLKIDKTFVQGLGSSDTTAEVAKAIISLSQGLKLEVVAEGAEHHTHVEFLQRYGCDSVQGFYFSKPVSAEQFEVLLRAGTITGGDV